MYIGLIINKANLKFQDCNSCKYIEIFVLFYNKQYIE